MKTILWLQVRANEVEKATFLWCAKKIENGNFQRLVTNYWSEAATSATAAMEKSLAHKRDKLL